MSKPNDSANKPTEHKVDAVENSSRREDERLEHGIKESFPGSDPVSVKVSKYAPGDPRGDSDAGHPDVSDEAGVVAGVAQQARDAAATFAESAKAAAGDVLSKSQEYVPEVEENLRKGKAAAEEMVRRSPITAVVTALLIGCGVAVVAYELMSEKQRGRS